MIILITMMERNAKTRRMELVTSHGVDVDTGKTVIVSCDHPEKLGAKFSRDNGEWVIENTPARSVA